MKGTGMSDELEKYIDYDPETGKLTRKISGGNRKAGQETTSLKNCGHGLTMVNKKRYASHRLAWRLYYGSWPSKNIDHINGNPSDNRIVNLRDVSQRENNSNRSKHRNGKMVGVYFSKPHQRWMSRIGIGKKTKYLGLFNTELEGHKAYIKALKDLENG